MSVSCRLGSLGSILACSISFRGAVGIRVWGRERKEASLPLTLPSPAVHSQQRPQRTPSGAPKPQAPPSVIPKALMAFQSGPEFGVSSLDLYTLVLTSHWVWVALDKVTLSIQGGIRGQQLTASSAQYSVLGARRALGSISVSPTHT